jgi:hypothetical protein
VVVVVAVLACKPLESPPLSCLVFSAAIIPLHRMGWGAGSDGAISQER